jgi:hypothetical protein
VAKKKKAKKPAQPGVDPNEKRRERLEAKRAAKAQALEAKRKREARERLIRRAVMVGLLGLAVWFLILRNVTPQEINGNRINDFSTAGANQHTSGTLSYADSPPVSGEHAPNPAPCGVHGEPIPNELMVHTLEHGSVGLLYDPVEVELDQIRRLEAIVEDYDDHMFSMPYLGELNKPVVVAAWGHTMELDDVDADSIEQFIEEFRNGGDAPEKGTPCDHQEAEPFTPEDENPDDEQPVPGETIEITPSPTD